MKISPKKGIAFLDVDHCLTRHASGLRFASDLISAGVMSWFSLSHLPPLYIWYRFLPLLVKPLAQNPDHKSPVLPRGLDEVAVKTAAVDFFEKRLRPDLYPEALELVSELKRQTWTIILASSSFDFLIEPLADYLKADDFIANAIEFSNGRSTGHFKGELVFGPGKLALCQARAQTEGLDLAACAFYSDSIHDLPLLAAVGKAVAVNPDWRLRRQASARGWPILRFGRG